MRCLRALLLLSTVACGCAALPDGPPEPPPEASFRGVRSVALVRRIALEGDAPRPGEGRRRDPLDALQGALAGRGVKTVTLELTPRPPPELAKVEQCVLQAEWAAQVATPGDGSAQVGTLGERAAPALEQLGADALVVFVRSSGWSSPPPYFAQPYGMAPAPSPSSAFAVVARDGTVVTFAWGGRASPYGAGPVNAAEAVDAVLALLLPALQE